MVVDDVEHAQLVSPNHAVFQFDVVVVALQLQERFLAILTDEAGGDGISFQCELVATFCQKRLSLLHIVVE